MITAPLAANPPTAGVGLSREVDLLAEVIGGMAAIKAVTSVAATYLRQHENLGSNAVGRYADFLIVDGDPVQDVRNIRKLTTV